MSNRTGPLCRLVLTLSFIFRGKTFEVTFSIQCSLALSFFQLFQERTRNVGFKYLCEILPSCESAYFTEERSGFNAVVCIYRKDKPSLK